MITDKNEQWNDYQENFDRITNLTACYLSVSNTLQREKRNVMARHMRKENHIVLSMQKEKDIAKNRREKKAAMKSYLAQCKAKGLTPHVKRIV